MSIRAITIDQLRRMEDQEGLVLQGCGGSTREWLDGINRMLTVNGCLKNDTVFTDVHVFQKDGSTCLLFPFTDNVKLDIGKLAIWRLRSHDRFGGTWLSDYVENELGGYIQEQPKQSKPDCPLTRQRTTQTPGIVRASCCSRKSGCIYNTFPIYVEY